MTKRVSLYQKSDALYISASHRTHAGFWIDDSVVRKLSVSQQSEIDEAVKAALACSIAGVSTPLPSADLTSPLLSAARATSWNAFVNGAKYVGIRQNDDVIKLTPYRNLGGKSGFEPIDELALLISNINDDLSDFVIKAISLSE